MFDGLWLVTLVAFIRATPNLSKVLATQHQAHSTLSTQHTAHSAPSTQHTQHQAHSTFKHQAHSTLSTLSTKHTLFHVGPSRQTMFDLMAYDLHSPQMGHPKSMQLSQSVIDTALVKCPVG
jgi:hypothetical protein